MCVSSVSYGYVRVRVPGVPRSCNSSSCGMQRSSSCLSLYTDKKTTTTTAAANSRCTAVGKKHDLVRSRTYDVIPDMTCQLMSPAQPPKSLDTYQIIGLPRSA